MRRPPQEAKLNRAILHALASKEPQSTRELCKRITLSKQLKHARYSTVNKRVRRLEQSGFVRKTEIKEKPWGITNIYELRPKAYLLMFLDTTEIETLLSELDDASSEAPLGLFVEATRFDNEDFSPKRVDFQ